MALVKINVYPRTTAGKNENRRTRAAGFTPAVLYGSGREATMVQLNTHEFTRILQKTAGRSVIYDLQLEGADEHPLALLREMQRHPVTDVIRHVDLFEIPRNVPVTVNVSLVLEGEPSCVKFAEGEVLQLLDSVELSCLPRELPDAVRLDVSQLKINDKLFVKDIAAPVGTIVNDPDTQVLVVKPVSLFADDAAVAAPAADAAADAKGKSDD